MTMKHLWAFILSVIIAFAIGYVPAEARVPQHEEGSDYKFIEDCFEQYLKLFKRYREDLDPSETDTREKMMKAIEECSLELKRYKENTY